MKYLHRNKMKQFYGNYSKNNTTPSKGQHHNHQHMVIMNENAENGKTNDVFVFNFVTSAINKAVDNTMNKYEEIETSGVEESKSDDKTETVKETVETPQKVKGILKRSPLDSLDKIQLVKLIKSKGVERIINPASGREKNINNLSVEVLRKYAKEKKY